jgi:hypothetical protein
MAFNDDPDIELQGVLIGSSAKAYQFLCDWWKEPEWVPKSQAEWVPDPESSENRGTMFVRAWLAKKNGWREV